MIIALTSEKGGVGKSTVATNIAVALASGGYVGAAKDVILIDADKQSTSSNWASDRGDVKDTVLAQVNVVQKYDNIKPALQDLSRRYDIVVVDCAGRDSREMRSALLAADIAIIPVRCSQPDLDTLEKMNAIVAESRDFNPGLRAFVLLSLVPTNPVIEDDARRLVADYPELKLLETRICDRKAYRDAMSSGRGVVELGNGKGKDEILGLLAEVCGHGL